MKKIFIKTLKENWTLFIILCLVNIVTLWMYISLFPTFSKQSSEYEKLLAQFPKEMWEIFGIQNGQFGMSSIEQFLSIEMFSLLWPIMMLIFFISIGTSIIAGEINKGTMEILLSLPISRIKLFLSKYMACILLIVAICFISVYCILPLAKIYNIEFKSEVYLKLFIEGSLFALSGFGISTMCSSIFDKGKASAITTGLYLFMYIINIISTLKVSLKDLQYISFFHYLDMSNILTSNKLNIQSLIVFTSVFIITSIIALFYFNKRDISI